MESIWSKTTQIPAREPLLKNLNTEVAIIGGGLAGILTAYQLQRKGIKAVVLEASRIGSGQTKNTTAKITSQHNLIYNKLIKNFGEEKARQYANANQEAIAEYRRIINEKNIDCMFEERPAYLYSTMEDEPLRQEAEAAKSLGIDAEFTTETSLPFPIKGGVKFNGQAQFHPLKFLEAIANDLTIFENTKVKKVEKNKIITEHAEVMAKHIVFATHFPFINMPGYYFMRMHQERSYVLALENAVQLGGMYIGIGGDGLSFRNSGDLLFIGGSNHRTGENREGGQYEMLRRKAAVLWPESTEAACWSAQDCMPLDSVPYIGKFSSATPDWYVATGFGKWGMTSSMVSAMLLSDAITGVENPIAEVFSPGRFTPSASAKSLFDEGLHAVVNLSQQIFAPSRADIEALPAGHGGVVKYENQKVGVYKDENNKVFIVSTRCSHLGCQLEWNPEEKTWDCPCHGSRFDYKGNLINNPALDNLPHA